VCTGEIIPRLIRKSNLHFPSVPTIQTIKGRVVFFRKGREKISTLKPSGFLPLPFRRQKRRTGFYNPAPRFRPLHFTAKPSALVRRLLVGFAVALPPRPRPPPKNRMDGKGGYISSVLQGRI